MCVWWVGRVGNRIVGKGWVCVDWFRFKKFETENIVEIIVYGTEIRSTRRFDLIRSLLNDII